MKDNNKGLITRFYGFGTMKRAIAFLLAAVMLLMIVGCGKNSDAPAENGPTSDGGSQNEYSEYSELLQNVMSDAEYNDLIARAQKDNKFYSSAEFDAHPYAFLEKEGFDIAKIKNGSIPCHTMTYVLDEEPNNLYIYTRVEKTDAYYLYLLRYTLTEKEMDDYNMLNYTGGTRVYVQALFINNEIAKTRNPEIIGTSVMTQEAYDGLLETYKKGDLLKTRYYEVALINPDKEKGTFTVIVLPYSYESDNITIENKIIYLQCRGVVRFNNGVYIAPYAVNEISAISRTEYNGTCYYAGDIVMEDAYYTTFTKN